MSIIYLTASYNEKIIVKKGTIVNIRYATMADLDDIASVESVCFPVLEAATKEEFEQRIKYFGNHFWLMFDEGITDKSTHGNVLWHQMRLDFKLRNNGVKQI